jgi:hypothetical protein
MWDNFASFAACLRAEKKKSASNGLLERSRKFLPRIEHPEYSEDSQDDERVHAAFPFT